jgi:hypothetical protein
MTVSPHLNDIPRTVAKFEFLVVVIVEYMYGA